MAEEQRVTPLELFFDLVFVFAFTQVTALMADNPTWEGLAQGMLILALLWWAWAAYSWLTNELDPEAVGVRIPVFVAMTAMLVAALAVPEAFDARAYLFVGAYLIVRVTHIVLFARGTDDVNVAMAARGLGPGTALAGGLLLAASTQDGAAQGTLWAVALLADYGSVYVRGVAGFRLHPAHFAERFGLIMIIALGESIVAVGVGVEDQVVSATVVIAGALGTLSAAALWWAYFDVMAIVGERRLRALDGVERAELGRDAYAVLHLPMVAGVVLFALGMKKVLGDVEDPLKTVPAVALLGGLALYLAAHVAFRLRVVGSLNRQRLAAAFVLVALIPLATEVDALVSLALATAVLAGLTAYESIRFRETRARVRGAPT